MVKKLTLNQARDKYWLWRARWEQAQNSTESWPHIYNKMLEEYALKQMNKARSQLNLAINQKMDERRKELMEGQNDTASAVRN